MSYWDEVREVLIKGAQLASEGFKENVEHLTNKAKEGFSSATETVLDKTKEGIRLMKLKSNLYLKQKEYQTVLADIGNKVYKVFNEKKDIYSDSDINELIKKANSIENECKNMEKEIESIKKEAK